MRRLQLDSRQRVSKSSSSLAPIPTAETNQAPLSEKGRTDRRFSSAHVRTPRAGTVHRQGMDVAMIRPGDFEAEVVGEEVCVCALGPSVLGGALALLVMRLETYYIVDVK